MPLNINNSKVEKIIYNGNQVNITKYKGEIILEDNYLKIGNYTGNPTLTTLNKEITFYVNFISNNIEFEGIKITSSYVYYIKDDDETAVYSFSNKSWANLYKSISISQKVFIDSSTYDWFNINYILI